MSTPDTLPPLSALERLMMLADDYADANATDQRRAGAYRVQLEAQLRAALEQPAGNAAQTQAARDVLAERARQISAEGYTPEHDDEHDSGELALAAALYAIPYESHLIGQDEVLPLHMALDLARGWSVKPEPNRRKRLVKAGALLLAEIERLDRAAAQQDTPK